MALWNRVPGGSSNTLNGAVVNATAVPSWYARRFYVESIKVEGDILDLRGEPSSFRVGNTILIVGVSDDGKLSSVDFANVRLLEEVADRRFKMEIIDGIVPTGHCMLIRTFALSCDSEEMTKCIIPVTMEELVADREGDNVFAAQGITSPGWWKHICYTKTGGAKAFHNELLVSMRSMSEETVNENIDNGFIVSDSGYLGILDQSVLD